MVVREQEAVGVGAL